MLVHLMYQATMKDAPESENRNPTPGPRAPQACHVTDSTCACDVQGLSRPDSLWRMPPHPPASSALHTSNGPDLTALAGPGPACPGPQTAGGDARRFLPFPATSPQADTDRVLQLGQTMAPD